jgi:hypothetical protein
VHHVHENFEITRLRFKCKENPFGKNVAEDHSCNYYEYDGGYVKNAAL